MNNYQKNSRNPSVPFSCMLEQLKATSQDKSNEWYLNNHMWSLNLNLGFKPTSFNLFASCISPNHNILPSHDHASYCRIALIVFLLCLSVLVPSQQTCTDDVIDDTDEELYYLQKCHASKISLFIPIQSHSLAPALFYCIRTTPIQLLHVAVVEPLYPLHDLSLPQ